MMPLNLRIADENDAGAIAVLVNRAYRPAPHEAGWTHESSLVSGKRISAAQVLSLFGEKSLVLLLCTEREIVACVHVQAGAAEAYIGMLATDPAQQAAGIGKQLLEHAERYAAEEFGSSKFRMSVLSARPELLAFYERRGYVRTGEVQDFPLSAGVGEPLLDGIKLLSLVKDAASPA